MKWLAGDGLRRLSVQLASDGRWESAISVGRTGPGNLRSWIDTAGADVAIESVYCDGSGALKGFFGFRRPIENSDQRLSFWQDVVAASAAYDSCAPGEQLAAWLAILGQPSLLSTEAAGIQLGVFNQWLSAGPVTLRRDRLERSDLDTGPAWIRDGATAPICRELHWLAPDQFWVAEVVSTSEDGRYRLDRTLLPA